VTYISVEGRKTEITISNVFYVKDMDKNLMSFARVTDEKKKCDR